MRHFRAIRKAAYNLLVSINETDPAHQSLTQRKQERSERRLHCLGMVYWRLKKPLALSSIFGYPPPTTPIHSISVLLVRAGLHTLLPPGVVTEQAA